MLPKTPPTKPTPYAKRNLFYAQYREDELDEQGNVVARRQRYIPLVDESGQRITGRRAAQRACDVLYERILAEYEGVTEREGVPPELLAPYAERYLTQHTRRAGTRRSYGTKLASFMSYLKEEHGIIRFAELTREHVKGYLAMRRESVKPVTVAGDWRALRAFLREAMRDGHVPESITKGISAVASRMERASEGFFTSAEMNAIVQHCRDNEPEWLPIFAGYRYTGCRRDELLYLQHDDIDTRRDLIRIADYKPNYEWRPKRSGRTIDLHPALKTILAELPCEQEFVFSHPDGATYANAITDRRELGRKAWRKIKRLCDVLQLEAHDPTGSWNRRFPNGGHLRAFRSGISIELQLAGAPLAYVQALLGHHDSSITLEHYSKIVPELMGRLTKPLIETLGSVKAPQ